MARMDKTIKDYQQHLTEKAIKNIPEFIQSILDADITKGKYSRFLLNCFIQNKFRLEDLQGGLDSTVGQAITLFHKHKSKLPEEMRSIYQYDSPGSLWNAVKQFDGELSGKEIKREEQDRIYAETEFVYEDEESGFKIVSPLTMESAKWWGKGTRWCTSAEKNNMFKFYNEEAPLLIFLMPDGERLQFFNNGFNVQICMPSDNNCNEDELLKYWDYIKDYALWSKDIAAVPKKYMNEEVYLESLKKTKKLHRYLVFFPQLVTKEETMIEVSKNIFRYKYKEMPKKFRHKEFFRDKAYNLPDDLSSYFSDKDLVEIVTHCLDRNPNAYIQLPIKLLEKNEELLIKAFKNGADKAYISNKFTPSIKVQAQYINNIKENGFPSRIEKYMKKEQWLNVFKQDSLLWNHYIWFYQQNDENYKNNKKGDTGDWMNMDIFEKKEEVDMEKYDILHLKEDFYDLCKDLIKKEEIGLYEVPKVFHTDELIEICKNVEQNIQKRKKDEKEEKQIKRQKIWNEIKKLKEDKIPIMKI